MFFFISYHKAVCVKLISLGSQVALGNMNELLNADYNADKLPKGKHSVWGKGRVGPDPKKTFVT